MAEMTLCTCCDLCLPNISHWVLAFFCNCSFTGSWGTHRSIVTDGEPVLVSSLIRVTFTLSSAMPHTTRKKISGSTGSSRLR